MIPNEGNGSLVDQDLSQNSENVSIEGPPECTVRINEMIFSFQTIIML